MQPKEPYLGSGRSPENESESWSHEPMRFEKTTHDCLSSLSRIFAANVQDLETCSAESCGRDLSSSCRAGVNTITAEEYQGQDLGRPINSTTQVEDGDAERAAMAGWFGCGILAIDR